MIFLHWWTAFLSGAAVLVVELAATRALAPFFGQALFVWTNVIGLVLLGLAVGAMVGGRLADRHPRPGLLAVILCLGAGLVAGSTYLAPAVARAILPAELRLEAAYPFLLKGSFLTTLVAFVPAVILLGAVPPFLVRCSARHLGEVGRASGLLYGASTLGSIAGTFLTSYLLLPYFGTRGSLLLASGLLVLSAVPLAFQLGRRTAAAGMAAAGVLVSLSPALPGVVQPAVGLAHGELLHAEDSAYQHIEIREREDLGARVLTLDEGHDSFQSLLPREGFLTGRYYDYYNLLAFDRAAHASRLRVLILGLAAGTHARQLLHFLPADLELRIVGVEIDPAVVSISRRYLEFPDDPRLEVVTGLDGRAYLEHCGEAFDLIIVDCFSHQSYLPFHLASREFFTAARTALRPGGFLALNVFGYGASDPVVQAVVQTLARPFPSPVLVQLPQTANFLLYAAHRAEGTPLPMELDLGDLPSELQALATDFCAPFRSWHEPASEHAPVLSDDSGLLDALQDQRLRGRAWALRDAP